MRQLGFFVLIMLLLGIVKGYSQTGNMQAKVGKQSIDFVDNLNWEGILQIAKNENKYVFVDCYATWCSPCKWMEGNVYSMDSVGIYMNKHFISVRMQMDTGKHDDDDVQRCYPIAHEIKQKYDVGSYPCYLFFSPEGNAVHKCVGALGSTDFLSLAESAMDSKKQYYILLAGYRNGEKDYSQMPVLLEAARRAADLKASDEIALNYVYNYLDKFPENIIWTKEKIRLIDLCLDQIKCDDKIFELFYRKRKTIDSVLNNPDYADNRINFIIYREKIQPILDKAKNSEEKPRWARIGKDIAKAYGLHYAKINVLTGLIEYNNSIKNWHQYVKYFIQFKEEKGIEKLQPTTESNRGTLNNAAYEVFEYGNKEQLIKALSWVDRALSTNKSYFDAIDTKANILYKLGRKEEALALEEQARALVPKHSLSYAGILENYDKMKKGSSTWISK